MWAYLLDGERGHEEETLVFSIKEGDDEFTFPQPTASWEFERLHQKRKVWGTPFSEKDLSKELEGDEEDEGEVFEFEVFPSNEQPHKVRAFQARGVEETEEERVEELRKKIFADYEGKVLDNRVPRDPPNRGPFGTAHIYLKPGAQPTRQKVYTMFGEKLEAHKQVTKKWIENGYIEPVKGGAGKAGWLSMTFPVPKKNPGEWRGVVDMRGPNSQTQRHNYPLPVIEDLLVKQGAMQIFSILDLKQAFHQQSLREESRHITACYTPLGLYQWKVNVMGLANAPQQFQEMVDWVLRDVRVMGKSGTDAYMDDILV